MFKILPGALLGWGLGSNDTSNIFGTAVANRIIKFSQAALITSVFVILGALLEGDKTFHTVGNLFVNLAYSDIFSITLGAAISVAVFTYMKLPISTSQALVGSILGIGFIKGEQLNTGKLIKIILCWITTPIGGFIIGFLLYLIIRWIFSKIKYGVGFYNNFVKFGIIIAGGFGAYSLGANNVGNVTGIYAVNTPNMFRDGLVLFNGFLMKIGIPSIPVGSFLSSTRFWGLLGGIFIAIGVYTYSKRVMITVGKKISSLDPLMALVAVLAESITIWIYTQIGVPVSTSQAIVGAVAGVGAVKSIRNIQFRMLGKIGLGWLFTPLSAAGVTILIHFIVRWIT